MSDPPVLVEQDFAAYAGKRSRDPDFNGYRLLVRRKLDVFGKDAVRYLDKEADLRLTSRTSLNHPHATNRNRVSRQIAYLSRRPEDKKALTAIVGPALAKDVDTHYVQTTLAVQIDEDSCELALRIHAMAWWDGQNLKNRVGNEAEMDLCGELINRLPQGFALLMDNWRKEYLPGSVSPQDLQTYFNTYTPGEHWLHVRRRLDKNTAIALHEDFGGWAREGFLALADLYRFICWSPDSNWLFGDDGKMRR